MDLMSFQNGLLAFQQAETSTNPFFSHGVSMPWFGTIALVAIVTGCITSCVAGWQKHRERMEMIRHGMHPDHPPEDALVKTSHPEL